MQVLSVYDVTCPASTPVTAPIEVVTLPSDFYQAVGVQVVIPDGHAGLTGIGLAYGHQVVIPYNAGAWISGNDERLAYDLTDYPPGVGWSVFLVNLDGQAHSWETRWTVDVSPTGATPKDALPLAVSSIYNVAPSLR